jgi:hypothetical protein
MGCTMNTVSRADTDHDISVPERRRKCSKANDEPFLFPRVDAIGF